MIPIIGITQGDYNGIGPEIILKTMLEIDLTASVPLLIGRKSVFDYYNTAYGLGINLKPLGDELPAATGSVYVLEPETGLTGNITPVPGKLTENSGRAAMQAIEKAVQLILAEQIHAMVTAPISKEAVNLAGYHIPGHTEFLAEKTGADSVLMILVNNSLRVALCTVHIPVSQIASSISKELILENLKVLDKSLREDFGINSPTIAVLGLNPHAGDGGVLGNEETEIINPAIHLARNGMITASGPFPADGFFGQKLYQNFDAVLAMYHDQGLAPFKALSFGSGVNFTAGLPVIRTSPDHGTAFNIAGKGVANPSSFKAAYELAVHLAKKKYAHD